jgi:hypothetical protein
MFTIFEAERSLEKKKTFLAAGADVQEKKKS